MNNKFKCFTLQNRFIYFLAQYKAVEFLKLRMHKLQNSAKSFALNDLSLKYSSLNGSKYVFGNEYYLLNYKGEGNKKTFIFGHIVNIQFFLYKFCLPGHNLHEQALVLYFMTCILYSVLLK